MASPPILGHKGVTRQETMPKGGLCASQSWEGDLDGVVLALNLRCNFRVIYDHWPIARQAKALNNNANRIIKMSIRYDGNRQFDEASKANHRIP